MSGDGCNIKNSTIYQATTISRELAESLVLAVQKVYNIGCRIYYDKRPKKCVIENRLVNQNDTYMIRFNLQPKRPLYLVSNKCIWYPIKKITDTHTQQTIYNLTVADDHTYIANNCYVGNCQDFSVAGLQKGGDKGSGTRSSLMYETLRLVEELKPKYVLWENVKNILSKKHKHNFNAYLDKMVELGYNNYYEVLNAKNYGIPQNRERVFTISIRQDVDTNTFTFPQKQELKLKLKDILEENVDEKYYLTDEQMKRIKNSTFTTNRKRIQEKDYCDTLCARDWKDPKCVQIGTVDVKGHDAIKRVYDSEGISPTLTNMQGGNRQPKVAIVMRVRKLTPKECWRLMGFDDEDFEKAKAVPTSNTQLYKQARKLYLCTCS